MFCALPSHLSQIRNEVEIQLNVAGVRGGYDYDVPITMLQKQECYRNILLCLCACLCGLQGGLIVIDLAGMDKDQDYKHREKKPDFFEGSLYAMEYSVLCLLSALPSADLFWLLTTKSGSFIQALIFFS